MEDEKLFEYIPVANKQKDEESSDMPTENPEDVVSEEEVSSEDPLKPYLSVKRGKNHEILIQKSIPARKEKVYPLDKAFTLIASSNDTYTIKRFIELDRIITNSRHRKCLLRWAIIIITLHIIAVLWIVTHNNAIVSLFHIDTFFIKISDNVLMVLLGSTTANIIGLGYIVLKGIFYKDDIHNDNNNLDEKEDNPIS